MYLFKVKEVNTRGELSCQQLLDMKEKRSLWTRGQDPETEKWPREEPQPRLEASEYRQWSGRGLFSVTPGVRYEKLTTKERSPDKRKTQEIKTDL